MFTCVGWKVTLSVAYGRPIALRSVTEELYHLTFNVKHLILGLEWYRYWDIGYNTTQYLYSQILGSIVIGGYFLFWHPIQYQSESSQHHPHASERLFSSAFELYSDRCNHLSGHHADMLLFIKHNHCHLLEFWDFSWSLLCYTLVSVLGIGIARGQYYWILGAFLGIVLTQFNTYLIQSS